MKVLIYATAYTAIFTWMLMLFLGNLGVGLGFVGCLPAGFLLEEGFALASGRGE